VVAARRRSGVRGAQKFEVDVSLLIPTGSLPAVAAGHWVELVQFAYGAPFAGSGGPRPDSLEDELRAMGYLG
jgi:hypothetical protein